MPESSWNNYLYLFSGSGIKVLSENSFGLAGRSSVTSSREERPRVQKTKKMEKQGSEGLTQTVSYAKQMY